jgi:phage gpG-like protein
MGAPAKSTRIRVVGGEIQFRYTEPGKTSFAQAVSRFGENLDWPGMLDEFLPYQLRSIDRNFQAEGRPQRWAPLQPNTIRERLRLGFGRGPILQRSGKLRRGFKGSTGQRVLRIWNRRHYFPHHQFGAPRANIPARRMIVLLPQDKAMFTRIVKKHVRLGDE